jgi:hypothetical protein
MNREEAVSSNLRVATNGIDNLLLLDGRINILKGAYFRRAIAAGRLNRKVFLPVMKSADLEEGMIQYLSAASQVQRTAITNLHGVLDSVVDGGYEDLEDFVHTVETLPNQLLAFLKFWQARRRSWSKLPVYAPLDLSSSGTEAQALQIDANYQRDKKKGVYQQVEQEEERMAVEDQVGEDAAEKATRIELSQAEPALSDDRWTNGRNTGTLRPLSGCRRQISEVGESCEYLPSTSNSGSADRSATSSDQGQGQVDDSSSAPILGSSIPSSANTGLQSSLEDGLESTGAIVSKPPSLPSTPSLRQTMNPSPLQPSINRQLSPSISPVFKSTLLASNVPPQPFIQPTSKFIPQRINSSPRAGLLPTTPVMNRLHPSATIKTKAGYVSRPTTPLKGLFSTPNPTLKLGSSMKIF